MKEFTATQKLLSRMIIFAVFVEKYGKRGNMVYGSDIYGQSDTYGGSSHSLSESRACARCGEGWRIESTDLSTGVVKAVLHPISCEWEEQYSRPGSGTLSIAAKGPSIDDVWPHDTGIYISRVSIDGTRIGHFGGYIERVSVVGGSASIGLQPLDEFPLHRLLANSNEGLAYSTPSYVSPEDPGPGKSQTEIATDLINLAINDLGFVPLTPVAEASSQTRVRSWAAYEFKNLGEAIRELVDTISGVKYRLEHRFYESPARWQTYIRFFDEENIDRGVEIRSDQEAYRYGLEIDARDQASRIYGVGTGEGSTQMFSVAVDEDASSPEFQATVAWKDVTVAATLDENTRGSVTLRRDPATTPTATLVGINKISPDVLLTGDIVSADIGYGVATFRDEKARVTSQSWRLSVGEPITRSLGLDPIIRPSISVKTQTPAIEPPVTIDVEQTDTPQTPIAVPTPPTGLVTTVRVGSLNEISGMQYAKAGNSVWLHNDENNTPQVILVSLSTGEAIGSYTPSGPSRKDPESIRAHPDGRLFLGDIGDNDNNRSSVRLYATSEGSGGGQTFDIRYPFGPANAEALLIHPTTGEIIIVTKDGRAVSFGSTGVPAPTGTQIASGLPNNISDGTFTTNGKFMLFTVSGLASVYVYSFPEFVSAGTISIPNLTKCESITVEGPCSFLVSSEGENAPIHRVAIPTAFGSTCG